MYAFVTRWFSLLSLLVCGPILAAPAQADPLPGRDVLKFSQLPMIETDIVHADGTMGRYYGHDELSTAYGFPEPGTNIAPIYQGRFMADDFADNFNSPIVHVRWWGSYLGDVIHPEMPVNKFLISFEEDVPASPDNPFSHPGQPLLNQVVFRGPLAPGSGTFTETLIRGPDPILGESLYEYNAELHLDKAFPQKADTVYWLKIVAMVDVPGGIQFDPYNPPDDLAAFPITRWGWHNRDYTVPNSLASPNVSPGEHIQGFVGANVPVWHFQDDAVSGDIRIDTLGPGGLVMPDIFQTNFHPENYLDRIDGPGSPPFDVGIGQFSKDLAFELFTVPEPTTGLLLLCGCVGLACSHRRRAGT